MFELFFGQLKDKGPAVSIALLLYPAIQLGLMLQSPSPQPRISIVQRVPKIRSLAIDVVGESYLGGTSGRSASLIHGEGKYYLEYSCYSRSISTCKCKSFSGPVVAPVAESIIRDVERLKDQGASAQCCDHPYTTIQVDYGRGQRKKMLTLAGDLLSRYEKVSDKGPTIFGLECDSLPPPTPSPTK
jgi:hypothetical protein